MLVPAVDKLLALEMPHCAAGLIIRPILNFEQDARIGLDFQIVPPRGYLALQSRPIRYSGVPY
jgi:hypothetical protein